MDSPYAVVTGASSPIGAAIAKRLAPGRKLVLQAAITRSLSACETHARTPCTICCGSKTKRD